MKTNQQNPSMKWLRVRMAELEYTSLQQVAEDIGINRGNLYRYFTQQTRPSIDMLPALCTVLQVEINTLLRALEVISPKESL